MKRISFGFSGTLAAIAASVLMFISVAGHRSADSDAARTETPLSAPGAALLAPSHHSTPLRHIAAAQVDMEWSQAEERMPDPEFQPDPVEAMTPEARLQHAIAEFETAMLAASAPGTSGAAVEPELERAENALTLLRVELPGGAASREYARMEQQYDAAAERYRRMRKDGVTAPSP